MDPSTIALLVRIHTQTNNMFILLENRFRM